MQSVIRMQNAFRGRLRFDAGSDAGSSAVELVLLTPLVMVLTFVPIQLGLWMHGRQLVTAAAQEASHAAAAADLTPAQASTQGHAATDRFLADQRVVRVQSVRVERGPVTATATVEGTNLSMIGWLDLQVSATSSSGVEQFLGTTP